ncbi:MAG: thioredoxin family protein [Thalassovita sp.]
MDSMPPLCDFGWSAPDFVLPGTDGKDYALSDIRGPNGTLIIFMCNHCPYVLRCLDRLKHDVQSLQSAGIGVAAINANDATAYPDDSFENMQRLAQQHDFSFPYLHDASQQIAKTYDAVCTPDFFGFDRDLGLQYRGRLDNHMGPSTQAPTQHDLRDAMLTVAETGQGPNVQIPSMGCSIKWKAT